MLNIGLSEMLVVAILVIVFVGPDDLPRMMRTLGRNYAKLRRASEDLRRAFTLEVDRVESEKRAEEIRRRREELLARRRAQQAERAASQEVAEGPQPRNEASPTPDSRPPEARSGDAAPPAGPEATSDGEGPVSSPEASPEGAEAPPVAPDEDAIFPKGDAPARREDP
ncbi:MAG: hypothetical protein H6741_04165 [Alphaproteobacteria bacterium]|nr:hypothetical protein [Alphaproteobacteria bacterium]